MLTGKPLPEDPDDPWHYLDTDHPRHVPDHDHHWHRHSPDHEDWLSIWAEEDRKFGSWVVELYPDPEVEDDRCRRKRFEDEEEEAAQFVAEFMENHS